MIDLFYDCQSISDSTVNNPTCVSICIILKQLNEKLYDLEPHCFYKNINIDFSDNYLRDGGFNEICAFIMTKSYLQNNLTLLNLRNNRLTNISLPQVKKLLDYCKNLTIDLSINHIKFNNDNDRIILKYY